MSEEQYSESDLLKEIMSEPEESTLAPKTIRTGVAGNQANPAKTVEDGIRPHAVRWVFNPFEVINLMNKPASCGMLYLDNVVFNKIRSLKINVANSSHDKIANLPNDPHDPDRYQKFDRTSYMIARELEEHYGDKGVVIIEELTGEEDDGIAAGLNQILFGEEVFCAEDVNDPDRPCPVLPTLLEVMGARLADQLPTLDAETKSAVKNAAKTVRVAIGRAMSNAQTRIDYAQARVMDDKQPNRTFSPAEQRCFLALGLEVPNALPFVGRSQAQGQMQGIDEAKLGRAIAAGLSGAQAAPTFAPSIPNIPATAKTGAKIDDDSFIVSESDIEIAETPGGSRVSKKNK
jgi:hypothetical protein